MKTHSITVQGSNTGPVTAELPRTLELGDRIDLSRGAKAVVVSVGAGGGEPIEVVAHVVRKARRAH